MNYKEEKNITIFEHPLIQHKISLLRDKNTGTNEFRKLVEEIAMLEGFEAMGYLEKAKEIDPNREKANWAYPLYQCYYLVYAADDPRTLEMEKLLKQ